MPLASDFRSDYRGEAPATASGAEPGVEPGLEAALEALHEGLFTSEAAGRVTYANGALLALLGPASAGAVVGASWERLFTATSRQRIERDGLPALLRHGHWQGEVELLRADGGARRASLSLSAVQAGALVGLVRRLDGAPDAATLERLRQDASGERLEALRRLAGDLGHELNNVLTSILGYARFLEEDLPPDGQPHGFARQIAEAAQRAKRGLDEALAFARPGGGERQAVPVAAAVERAADALRAALSPCVTLRIASGGEDLAVEAAPAALANVLQQLLANAAEALGGEPGTVEVAWRPAAEPPRLPEAGRSGRPPAVAVQRLEGGRCAATAGSPDPDRDFLELVVRDSGSGMAPEVMDHLFEPFYTTRRPSKGRGLGLAAVFGQVSGHGGALVIDSAPDLGTTVRLYWPAAAAASPPAKDNRRQLPRGRGQRILVAEDDGALREALGEMLQRLGYRPVLVGDGEGARRMLAEGGGIEAVLTDRRMPNLSGTELIDWMRGHGLRQPVLLCTGYGEDLDAAGLTRGDVALLSKPIDAATLARSLERLLSGGSA